jgi:adenylate kinase family enzyme
VPIFGPHDALPYQPTRVLIGGTSGSGKSTVARDISMRAGIPYTEIDALHHGPGWTRRSHFLSDVAALSAQPRWITEYQYEEARPVLLARCDLVVYLLLPRRVVMARVVRRTVRRSRRREVLWNGNVEPPLRTFLTNGDHIVRWAWRTHGLGPQRLAEIEATYPLLPVVALRSPRDVVDWLAGPFTDAQP